MPNPEFLGVSHFGLSVSDIDKSAKWYEQVLGLQPINKMELPNRTVVFLVHSSTGLVVGLAQHSENIKGNFDEMRIGLDHLALAVGSKDDLDVWESYFTSLNVTHSPVAHIDMGSVLTFRDPDNIQLELFWRNPG